MNSLSGRFLVLTTLFVMLAEVLIFVPSVARFRQTYLDSALEKAQIAALAVPTTDMIDADVERELLETAKVYNVVLRRNDMRELALSSPVPGELYATYDLREQGVLELIRDAIARLIDPHPRIIRVIGAPVQSGGQSIEVTMDTAEMRDSMIAYGLRILALSLVISVVTASLLFLAVRRFLVKPIKGVISAMKSYAEAPEDARRIIEPKAAVAELRDAETALQALQTQLTSSLRQKERLAQLGAAVAKVSHDLRNILTSAQLFVDRMEASEDPAVRRLAPKLVRSISRAVTLCETTLAFGKAEEPPPMLNRVPLMEIVEDVLDNERLAAGDTGVTFVGDFAQGFTLRADADQLHRILANLVRNARQAIESTGRPGEVRIEAEETETAWTISVSDTGPGLPSKAQEHLFAAFSGGARKGGTGLGLAIAAELTRGHGGRLNLASTGAEGTTFVITLPKGTVILGEAAE